jgi:hypothetical protein
MNFHLGKIYNMPNNFYFCKSNQPKIWMEYCKKIKIPEKNLDKNNKTEIFISEPNNSCLEYCKNIIIFPEIEEEIISDDDDSWVDMKKIL